MNQQLLSLFFALVLLCNPFFLSACSQNAPTDSPTPSTEQNQTAEPEPEINPAPETLDVNGDGAVKILSLGNSFSVNAYKYLHPILTAYGVENVTLGNLYKGGCDLTTTALYAQGIGKYPTYYKYDTAGNRVEYSNYSLIDAIREEDWDVFTVQQASGFSGLASSFDPSLETIVACIRENRTVKRSHIMWHMTWAYQQDSNHANFPNYDSDQMTMYRAIVNAVEEKILTNPHFDMVIPAGTAIQNARTSSLGDTMTRDGYHLNDAACLIAGYSWYASMTGNILEEIRYVPEELNLSDTYLAVLKEAVNAAVTAPFEVTECEN